MGTRAEGKQTAESRPSAFHPFGVEVSAFLFDARDDLVPAVGGPFRENFPSNVPARANKT